METKKIKFVNFWPDFDPENNIFVSALKKNFDIEFSEEPDYVFCSCFGIPYEYLKYDGIRIFYAGENISPDWNTIDYALGYDPMNYNDRYLRLPIYWLSEENVQRAQIKHWNVTKETLKEKELFCNFICGNALGQPFRKEIFEVLQKYKYVVSAGQWMNNTPDGKSVKRGKEKFLLQQRCKFSIAVDSICQPGFVTEKIIDAFAAQTIPIYCGAPDIGSDFNPQAFINAKDFGYNFDRILKEVKRLDQNDEAYLNMLAQPAFAENNRPTDKQDQLENFLVNIFSQKKEKAIRTSRVFWGEKVTQWQKEYSFICKYHLPVHEVYQICLKIQRKIQRIAHKDVRSSK